MQIKCEYCDNYFSDKEEVCPYCNAPNDGIIRTGTGAPTTIEELKEFVKKHGIPAENLRFFIGQNYTGAKAFGIYKDEELGEFVVYKNKSDGSRAVRYQGKDEAYAVNEIYQKLKEECNNYKAFENDKKIKYEPSHSNNSYSSQGSSGGRKNNNRFEKIIAIIFVVIVIIILTNAGGCFRTGLRLLNGFSSGYSTDYDSGSSWSSWDDDDDDDGWSWGSDSDSSWDDDWDSDWDSGWDSDWGGSDWDSDW